MQRTVGNVTVTIYKRTTPNGKKGFMIAYKQDGKRKFDSYSDAAEAIREADEKARKESTLGVKAAQLTDDELRAFVTASERAKRVNLSLGRAVEKLVEAVEIVGDLSLVIEACKFYVARNKRTTRKPVNEVVSELLSIKEARGASRRYMEDLRSRLHRFADSFKKDACAVTTADIQAWFDEKKFGAQNFMGFRRTIHLFFKFAIARGYAIDNPAAAVERVKVKHGATQIFTPKEIHRLLTCANEDFLPCIAIGAFAGLRSAEIERLEWSDIDLEGKHITVGADKAKTASRRVVPISDNLAAWLEQYAGHVGNVWKGSHDEFYEAQQKTAAATTVKADEEKGIKEQQAVKWKPNALRHSYASYRFALTGDAGRVAGECGNSASVIHKHYRELVKPNDALEWFSVLPEGKAAPVKTKIPVGKRRQSVTNDVRMPNVGTAASN
jgi:integrase